MARFGGLLFVCQMEKLRPGLPAFFRFRARLSIKRLSSIFLKNFLSSLESLSLQLEYPQHKENLLPFPRNFCQTVPISFNLSP